jgi:hypothetical protein
MCEAADQAGKDPDRLSFMRSLRVIRTARESSSAYTFTPTGRNGPGDTTTQHLTPPHIHILAVA